MFRTLKAYLGVVLLGSMQLVAQAQTPDTSVVINHADVLFSRSNNVSAQIVDDINASTQSVYLLMYSLTDRNIAQALVQASQREDVRIVLDSSEAKSRGSEADYLMQTLPQGRVLLGHGLGKYGIMHEKMAIIDAHLVILGSYNWTTEASRYNWENILFLDSPDLALKATNEFSRVYHYAAQNPPEQ